MPEELRGQLPSIEELKEKEDFKAIKTVVHDPRQHAASFPDFVVHAIQIKTDTDSSDRCRHSFMAGITLSVMDDKVATKRSIWNISLTYLGLLWVLEAQVVEINEPHFQLSGNNELAPRHYHGFKAA